MAKTIPAPSTVAKRYKLPVSVVKEIDRLGVVHGSKGRAIQIGVEFLVRRRSPMRINFKGEELIGKSYKLAMRTAELIDELAEQYGTRGAVLAAAVRALAD